MFERPWNMSPPAEGEFPPSYVLEIGYNPDIRIDGNPNNDDCRLGSNRLERSGAQMRTLLLVCYQESAQKCARSLPAPNAFVADSYQKQTTVYFW